MLATGVAEEPRVVGLGGEADEHAREARVGEATQAVPRRQGVTQVRRARGEAAHQGIEAARIAEPRARSDRRLAHGRHPVDERGARLPEEGQIRLREDAGETRATIGRTPGGEQGRELPATAPLGYARRGRRPSTRERRTGLSRHPGARVRDEQPQTRDAVGARLEDQDGRDGGGDRTGEAVAKGRRGQCGLEHAVRALAHAGEPRDHRRPERGVGEGDHRRFEEALFGVEGCLLYTSDAADE